VSIIEAIKRAESEHAVYFLLTAYLESLWHSDNAIGLRGSLRKLPIDGETDVEERARLLSQDECTTQGAIVAEAAEIFRTASERLHGTRKAA
jgi:hypothetical protein